MRWPWQKPETRAGGSLQSTEAEIKRLESSAAGIAPTPETLAIVEACQSLWERCIGSATIAPARTELAGAPDIMALVGRTLALRGNALFAIRVDGSDVQLIPASFWDLKGNAGRWFYRLDLAGPSATESVRLPAASVLHFRIGADSRTPWRGRSPLERAARTAELAGRTEAGLVKDARVPVSRFLNISAEGALGHNQKRLDEVRTIMEGGASLFVMAPGVTPDKMGPHPEQVVQVLRSDVGRDICAAYGISPALFSERGDGAGQRESYRRFWLTTVAPIGNAIEGELQRKLHPAAKVTFPMLSAQDRDQRSNEARRRANAVKLLVDAGFERSEALKLSGLESEPPE